jgi:hypothetical protein
MIFSLVFFQNVILRCAWVAVLKLYLKKSFGGGKILAKDFGILLPKKVTLFAPNFAPSMQNRNSLTPPYS